MDATVILCFPPAALLDVLPQAGDDPLVRRAANGDVVRVRALEDCVQIDLGRSLTAEPLLLFARLIELVGEGAVARHADARGVPAYPTSYEIQASTWAAAVEELGEAAEWLPLELMAGPASAGLPDLGDLAAMLGPEGAALAAQLQGPQGAELMQSAMAMAQQLMAGGGLEQLMGNLGGMGQGETLDLAALKGEAENLLHGNPDLQRQLEAQFGGMLDGLKAPGEHDAPDTDEPDESE